MSANTLQQLFEEDRQTVLEALQRDRLPAAAQGVMEKELDRVMYRYLDQADDRTLSDAAQNLIAVIKQSLPLLGCTSDVRQWERTADGAENEKRAKKPATIALLAVGALLVAASYLAAVIRGVGLQTGSLLGLALTAVGGGLLYLAGRKSNGKADGKDRERTMVRREFLTDPEAVWGSVRNALMISDGILNNITETQKVDAIGMSKAAGARSQPEIETLAAILESAYALADTEGGQDAGEIIANIRFYLHGADYELQDFDGTNRSYFEMLPGSGKRTLRPAILREGKIVKKGAAAS